jgi:hypothetical protein
VRKRSKFAEADWCVQRTSHEERIKMNLSQQELADLQRRTAAGDRLATLINQPELDNFLRERVVIYRSEADGKVWVRPAAQFHDGRSSRFRRSRTTKHCVSAAAALYNWHCAIVGVNTSTLPANSDGEATAAAPQSGRPPKAGSNDAS